MCVLVTVRLRDSLAMCITILVRGMVAVDNAN